MFNSHVTPTHWSRRIASACSDNVNAFFHSPAVIAMRPSARMDNAIACGFPTLFASAFDCWTSLALNRSARRIRASGRRLDRHRAGDTVRFAGIERHQQVTRAEIRGADHVHQRQSRRRRPAGVHAKEGIGVDVVDLPRHEAQARAIEAARVATAATAAPHAGCGARYAHAREHAANQVQPADRCARR